jgi:hypothetical protein
MLPTLPSDEALYSMTFFPFQEGSHIEFKLSEVRVRIVTHPRTCKHLLIVTACPSSPTNRYVYLRKSFYRLSASNFQLSNERTYTEAEFRSAISTKTLEMRKDYHSMMLCHSKTVISMEQEIALVTKLLFDHILTQKQEAEKDLLAARKSFFAPLLACFSC